MYKPEILKPAQRELEEIAAVYLSLVGPSATRNITDKIFATLERLCNSPHIGMLSRDKYLKEAGYKIAVSGDYLCLYRLINNTLFVYYIMHGATDYPKLFKELKGMGELTSATRGTLSQKRMELKATLEVWNTNLLLTIQSARVHNLSEFPLG